MLVLATRALDKHQQAHPKIGHRDHATLLRRNTLQIRADAMLDAYVVIVADDLGVNLWPAGRDGIVKHAHDTLATVTA